MRAAASRPPLSAAASRLGLALMSTAAPQRKFVLDEFVLRQFDDKSYTGTRIDHDKAAFEARINELHASGAAPLVDGYAPFCKHVFVENFTPAVTSTLKITPQTEGALRSGYEARTPQELPVLVRWFPQSDPAVPAPPVAKWLDVILYSREQIRKETAGKRGSDGAGADEETAPWGIISVKAQDVDFELPMQPITVMRNALGVEEGGSGVALDVEAYRKSVAFWSENAPIK